MAATLRKAVAIPRAPRTPSRSLAKKTVTTRTFKGIPKRLIIVERCASGMYLLRRADVEGKYMPTHPSKTRKEMVKEASDGIAVDTAVVALPTARAATVNMRAVDSSVGIPFFERCPNRVAPIKQLAMKQDSTVP